ncbi:serine hydrolase [Kribbella ginsengisoli]|uniref:Serine hydrolase domain-containing protein n=1 Tax=Kribbella ginsengisoli TaxID=363865 RepID=A0ABP6Z715_9ACTN
MTVGLLEDFLRATDEWNLGVYGVHVYHAGADPIERRLRSDDRVNVYSVAKAFTAVALGLAQAEGHLTLDDTLLSHFPELASSAAEGVEQITLRHLLNMTSGTSHRWFADQRIQTPDLLHEIIEAPLEALPGQHFAYTGSGAYAIGRTITRAAGVDLRSYLMPRLFASLDLHNPGWHACPQGFTFAESDLFLRTHELARFAQLLLQEGHWGERQIVPASFVHEMVADPVDTSSIDYGDRWTFGYGLGVWIDMDGMYRMDGRYGQYVVICPRRKIAVTVTAHCEQDSRLLDAIHAFILDRVD